MVSNMDWCLLANRHPFKFAKSGLMTLILILKIRSTHCIFLVKKITNKRKFLYLNGSPSKEIIKTNDNHTVIEIIWEYIKLNENDLYSNILSFFDKDFSDNYIDSKWKKYIELCEWDPPKSFYDNNILLLNDEYDLYCDYVKWKKNVNNMNNIWLKFKFEEIQTLLYYTI